MRAALGWTLCVVPVGIFTVLVRASTGDGQGTDALGWLGGWGFLLGLVALRFGYLLIGKGTPVVWVGGTFAAAHGFMILVGVAMVFAVLMAFDSDGLSIDLRVGMQTAQLWRAAFSISVGCLSVGNVALDPWQVLMSTAAD